MSRPISSLPSTLGAAIALTHIACGGEELRSQLVQAGQNVPPEVSQIPAAASQPPPDRARPSAAHPEDKPATLTALTSRQGPACDRVAAADLNGDGEDEVIYFAQEDVTVGDHIWPLGGRPQQVARGDIDGDGDEELVVATGTGRGSPGAPIQLWALHADRAQLLHKEVVQRNQVVDLQLTDQGILFSSFTEEKMVQARLWKSNQLTRLHQAQMAMQMKLSTEGLVVGRLYGDAPKSAGDLSVIEHGASPRALPTLRGVKTLELTDLNDDGADELLVADGWHYAYGEHGVARLMVFDGPEWTESRPLVWLDKDYTIRGIEVAPTDSGSALLLTGSHGIYLAQEGDTGWRLRTIAKGGDRQDAVFRHQSSGLSVLVSGDPSLEITLGPQ